MGSAGSSIQCKTCCCECDNNKRDEVEGGPALLGSNTRAGAEVVEQIAILIGDNERSAHEAEGAGVLEQLNLVQQLKATGNVEHETQESTSTKPKRPRRPIPLTTNYLSNQSVTSWSTTPMGTLQHDPTGTTLASVAEVELNDQSYSVSKEDIRIEGVIAEGASGIVELASHKQNGWKFAVKTMKVASKELRQQMLHEIQGLVEAGGSPHVVQLFCGYMESGRIGLILEFMDGGCLASLKDHIGETIIPPRILANITRQIVHGLHHIHARSILHRDIKPHNILYNHVGEVKLTDFGLSKSVKGLPAPVSDTPIGTRLYMSPERVMGDDYTFVADIWSVGVVVFELAATHPFSCNSILELSEKLMDEPEPRLDSQKFSEPLCCFVENTIVRDTNHRPSAESLIIHPYVCLDYATQEEFVEWLYNMGM